MASFGINSLDFWGVNFQGFLSPFAHGVGKDGSRRYVYAPAVGRVGNLNKTGSKVNPQCCSWRWMCLKTKGLFEGCSYMAFLVKSQWIFKGNNFLNFRPPSCLRVAVASYFGGMATSEVHLAGIGLWEPLTLTWPWKWRTGMILQVDP